MTKEQKPTEDSPWQDAKDAREGMSQMFNKTNDFARHSTGRIIGPAATRLKDFIKNMWNRWTLPHEEIDRDVYLQPLEKPETPESFDV